MMRPIIFHPKARDVIRSFPKDARDAIGKGLYRLQMGEQLSMPNARPMPVLAPGAAELRVRDLAGIYRVFYYTATAEGILVFHAFVKQTRTTPASEIKLGARRLTELLG